MIIAYGGGLTLSIFPLVNPLELLKNALNDNSQYSIEIQTDSVRVYFSHDFIKDFIDDWKNRTPEGQTQRNNVILLEKILKNSYFDECRLDETGYFDAIFKTDSVEVENIFNEINSDPFAKSGLIEELETHFKDLYECVYIKTHRHIYIRLYELFCHIIFNENRTGQFDLNAAKDEIFVYFNNSTLNNIIMQTMENMDYFEESFRRQNFLEFLSNSYIRNIFKEVIIQIIPKIFWIKTKLKVSKLFKLKQKSDDSNNLIQLQFQRKLLSQSLDSFILPFYKDISGEVIFLRKIIWSFNYLIIILERHHSRKSVDSLRNNLENFSKLLSLRKEVSESVKNTISFFVSFGSIVIGFFGVLLAVIKLDFIMFIFFIILSSILFIISSYILYRSILAEYNIEGVEASA